MHTCVHTSMSVIKYRGAINDKKYTGMELLKKSVIEAELINGFLKVFQTQHKQLGKPH